MTHFNKHLIISKLFIILHHLYYCYINTLYNLFAHSSCTFLLILFIKPTVYCPVHFNLLHILFDILFLFFIFTSFYSHTYMYVYSLCDCIPYNCTVHGADLTYISLLIIFCIIVYVIQDTNPESKDRQRFIFRNEE